MCALNTGREDGEGREGERKKSFFFFVYLFERIIHVYLLILCFFLLVIGRCV